MNVQLASSRPMGLGASRRMLVRIHLAKMKAFVSRSIRERNVYARRNIPARFASVRAHRADSFFV